MPDIYSQDNAWWLAFERWKEQSNDAWVAVGSFEKNWAEWWLSRLCYWMTVASVFASLTSSQIVTFHLPHEPLWWGSETLYK